MTSRKFGGGFSAVLAQMLLCVSSGVLATAHAQVTPSGLGTLVNGSAVAPTPPVGGAYDITGGTRPGGGTNLFHSFGDFSPNAGESANFLNNSGLPTSNILARVTAGNPSNIFGTINTLDFGGANLFLMNPSGIVFGPTARLDVGGSFHATTADYIKLGIDGIFYADPGQASVLTAASPSAFGFLSADPKPIEVQTGGIDFAFFFPAAQLMVPEGQTLSLVGGNSPGSGVPGVSIGALDGSTPGYVVAPGGRVNLVSVASAGEATFDGTGFNVDNFSKLGEVRVGPGSLVDGKEIFIRGGKLAVNDGVILPGAFSCELSFVCFSPLPDGGEVNIKVTEDVTLTGSPFAYELLTFAPPGIFVYTGDPLGNFITPDAKVPDVMISAGSVSISGFAGIQVQRNAPGEAGNVTINADTVSVGSGGSIVLINAYDGAGPNLTINARQISVSGDATDSPFGFEGLAAQGLRNPAYPFSATDAELLTANSGSIALNASESLTVSGLGQITTDSRNFGKAGDITINAGNVAVAGTGDAQSALIGSQSNFSGDSGNITVNATGSITVTDGGRITSASLGSGNAGNVTLAALGPVTLSGTDARIVGATFQPPAGQLNALFESVFFWSFDDIRAYMGSPDASLMEVLAYLRDNDVTHPFIPWDVRLVPIPGLDVTPGDAGAVSVSTPQLTLNAGTRIETSTGWEGIAGSVVANVGNLSILDGGAIRSRSGVEFLDGTIGVGPGSGGSIAITADGTIAVSGPGSAISTSTFGDGKGGDVVLTANQVAVMNGGRVVGESGGTLSGVVAVGSGDGGSVSISAANAITVSDPNSTVSTTTYGAGAGGNVSLSANQINVQNGGTVTSESGGLLGGAVATGTGRSGSVSISGGTITVAGTGSAVSTSTYGDGKGGDISLDASNQVAVVNGGRVVGQSGGTLGGVVAVGSGDGGSVSIFAANAITVSDPNSTVSTTTYGAGAGGNVSLSANQVNVQSGGTVTSESGGQLGGALTAGSGAGGLVAISAGNAINISGQDAVVSTSTFGNGDGGNISLNAGSSVQISNGALVSADSLALVGAGTGLAGNITITSGDSITMDSGTISTRAVTSDGGDIKLDAPGTVYLNNSQITTSVESGLGAGGNISIDPQFVILNNSFIIANAFGGPGGNITIIADNFLSSATSVIEASSALSTPGVIQIQSPDNNVENSIAALTAAFLDASSQLRGLCSARRSGAPSSFTVAGRGGVPVEADGYLPSFGADASTASASAAGPARAAAGDIGGQPIALALVMPDSLNCMR